MGFVSELYEEWRQEGGQGKKMIDMHIQSGQGVNIQVILAQALATYVVA